MATAEANLVTNAIHEVSLPLEGLSRDYDSANQANPRSAFCLLGEATHGTMSSIASEQRSANA